MSTVSLDGIWSFVPDPTGTYSPENLPAGQPITVPGSWEAQVSGRYGVVRGWYRRTIQIPEDWVGRTVLLHFGAVMYSAEVWLDGRRLAEHEGGYTPFEVDLTPVAIPGQEHQLVVCVVNPLNALTEYPSLPMDEVLYAKDRMGRLPLSEAPHGKQTWYSSLSGIWQSVSIDGLPQIALHSVRVDPDLRKQTLTVQWSLRQRSGAATLNLAVAAPDGSEVASRILEIPAGTLAGDERIEIPSPRPWAVDEPNLYRLEASVGNGRGDRHYRTVRFGFRTIETRSGQVLLNGAPVYLRGALDQDVYPEGMTFTGDARALYREQFQRVREMGLNLLRCHIKVPDPSYLDAADEAGVLLWCELPNWTQFTSRAAAAGKQTLQSMVETMGHHPSVVIWTIINEDWGTRLREESRDRRWLLRMYDWLKALDPGRLIVDNSACENPTGKPNFHLKSDLADFHIYFSMPDKIVRWRNFIEDYAQRPPWLWSPHGDAQPGGDEPLVLSEFGSWGLPDITQGRVGEEPWWYATGRQLYQPSGALERFHHFGLDRIWRDWPAMATSTQLAQFEALQFEIAEVRRHPALSGYVITEFTDAYWEANGLLTLDRMPKDFHRRLAELNGPDMVILDLARRDLWGGERLTASVWLSSYGGPAEGATLSWTLRLDGAQPVTGAQPITSWPTNTSALIGELAIDLPDAEQPADAALDLDVVGASGGRRASGSWRLAIVPARRRRTVAPKRIAVEDPLGIWNLEDRVRALGHTPVAIEDAEVLITTEMTMAARQHAERGGRVLLLIRSRLALPPEVELEREIVIHPRWLLGDHATDPRNPWRGDWISAFNWILPGAYPDLPARSPLDFAYQEVIPDHVLRGYHPHRHADEVTAGVFVGWVHAPAALLWSFRQGGGVVTATTLKLAPEAGPVATVLLEDLIQGGAVEPAPALDKARVAVP